LTISITGKHNSSPVQLLIYIFTRFLSFQELELHQLLEAENKSHFINNSGFQEDKGDNKKNHNLLGKDK